MFSIGDAHPIIVLMLMCYLSLLRSQKASWQSAVAASSSEHAAVAVSSRGQHQQASSDGDQPRRQQTAEAVSGSHHEHLPKILPATS